MKAKKLKIKAGWYRVTRGTIHKGDEWLSVDGKCWEPVYTVWFGRHVTDWDYGEENFDSRLIRRRPRKAKHG
jgi:hypothetical protein